jgi:DnaJ-class molecular chaperone
MLLALATGDRFREVGILNTDYWRDKMATKAKIKECPKCAGCGQIANDEKKTPWKYWADLPPGSDLGVRMGLVRPETCPRCKGTGQI